MFTYFVCQLYVVEMGGVNICPFPIPGAHNRLPVYNP